MKQAFTYILMFWSVFVSSQSETQEGLITFIASSNVYVRFDDTELINLGDTLFKKVGSQFTPCLLVEKKSSTSCVCSAIDSCVSSKNDKVYFQQFIQDEKQKEIEDIATEVEPLIVEILEEEPDADQQTIQRYKEAINARISAASYSNLSNQDNEGLHRTMLRMSLNMDNISGSPFSIESYINYRKNYLQREVTSDYKTSFFNVYNLAISFTPDSSLKIFAGRKINRKASSIGPIDGLQAEKYWGKLYTGAILGFRPDIRTFGFNSDLFEYGGYLGFETHGSIYSLSTLGLLEQRNRGAIDRRYAYVQHSSSLLKKLRLFSSLEVDLYRKVNGNSTTDPRLTNLFISLNYKFSRKVNATISYDSRRRIIYYETLRTDIENLLADDIARQGLRLRIAVSPLRYINGGISFASRFQNDNQNASTNINGFLSHSRLPGIGGRLSMNYNHNESNYLTSNIFSIRHSRSLIDRKLNGDFSYRRAQYSYFSSEVSNLQQYFGTSLSLRINKSLRFSLLGEMSLREEERNIRINTKLIKRFNKR
ncbi:MAG: hypothetical protein HKN68_06640 [Saprospiraceae bacterium]|nr:hypothetical protein [Saprospiraceae bacterium]